MSKSIIPHSPRFCKPRLVLSQWSSLSFTKLYSSGANLRFVQDVSQAVNRKCLVLPIAAWQPVMSRWRTSWQAFCARRLEEEQRPKQLLYLPPGPHSFVCSPTHLRYTSQHLQFRKKKLAFLNLFFQIIIVSIA
jgi:hypothetical protein